MKKGLILILFSVLAQSVIASERTVAVIEAEFWASPRNAELVLENESVKAAVGQLLSDPEAYLVLHFPVSEEGELWGQELHAWLVSLGIISDRIELRPGFIENDGVELLIVSAEGDQEPEVFEIMPIEEIIDVLGGDESVPDSSVLPAEEDEVGIE